MKKSQVEKPFCCAAIICIMMAFVTGCDRSATNTANNEKKAVVLKLGHVLDENHPYNLAAVQFKQEVEKATEGKITIDIYPAGKLGDERALIKGLTEGKVDMAITSSSSLEDLLPELEVFDLPYLFRDREHVNQVLDGPVGNKVMEDLRGQGIYGLAWMENGFRHLTNSSRPINKPGDLKGLKFRTRPCPIYEETFKALGAEVVPLEWLQVAPALKQKTIAGQENPLITIEVQKLYEVQPYLALTGHAYSPALFMINRVSLQRLAPEQKQIIKEAAARAAAGRFPCLRIRKPRS
jgi:tripartite ATP-independent transporter DctP family solute receptor